MFDINQISKQRSFIYGVATLWIVIIHSPLLLFESIGAVGKFLDFFCSQDVGVDIFLFMSGISLYYSYSKDSNLKSFYLKRVLRLFPPAMLIALITCIVYQKDLVFSIKRILLVSFFTDGDLTFWYVSFLFLLYILYPFILKLFEKAKLLALVLLIVVAIVGTYIWVVNSSYATSIQIALTRIPVFLVGVYLGKYVKKGWKFPAEKLLYVFIVALALFAGILLMGWEHPLALRWIYCPLSVCLTLLFAWLGDKLGKFAKPLEFLGKYSFEVYLIHGIFYVWVMARVPLFADKFGIIYSAIIFAIVIPLAMLLSKLNSLVLKKVS